MFKQHYPIEETVAKTPIAHVFAGDTNIDLDERRIQSKRQSLLHVGSTFLSVMDEPSSRT